MRVFDVVRISILTAVMSAASLPGFAKTPFNEPKAQSLDTTAERDGQHDFDFLFGNWKVHCRRLLHPLSGSNDWIEFDATDNVHPMWNGRANVEEFEGDTPVGHTEGMTIRTYNTKSRQWSIYWSTQRNGTVDFPPMVGEFKNGRGEFYDSELFNGQGIYVRFIWIVNSPTACHWEQAFSADGGRTWETNFTWDLTRDKSKGI